MHELAPDCVMVKVLPATLIVPLRSLVLDLVATVNETVPLPLPLDPPVMWIHAWAVVALQPQPDDAETLKLPEPPLEAKDREEGEREYEHVAGAAPRVKRPCP